MSEKARDASIKTYEHWLRIASKEEAFDHAIAEYLIATNSTATEVKKLRDALYECEEYFENRSDADHDETGFVPNEEMKLLHTVRDALLGASDAEM